MPTPYAEYVTGQNPLAVLQNNAAQYDALFARLTTAEWQQPWAPGKWTRHEVLVHVAQWELIFSTRIRMALAIPNYVVQPMDQDPLLNIEAPNVDTTTAAAALAAVRRMNIALVAGLTPEQRAHTITHPERGVIDIEDLIVTLAGHAAHHVGQIENKK